MPLGLNCKDKGLNCKQQGFAAFRKFRIFRFGKKIEQTNIFHLKNCLI